MPPAGAVRLADSDHSLQAFRLAGAPVWGIQFHAEVSATDARRWIEHYEVDPDAVEIGIDPGALWAETEEALPRGRKSDAASATVFWKRPTRASRRRRRARRPPGSVVAFT